MLWDYLLDCDGDFQGERERQGDFADAFFLYAVCDLFGDDFALCGANPSATARLHGCRDDWTGKLLSCNAFNRDFV